MLALALAGVSSYSAYVTRQETSQFARESESFRSAQAEQLVSDAYGMNQDWSMVQYSLQQVGRLYGWRVVITDHDGFVVADSHNLIKQYKDRDKPLDVKALFSGPIRKRPLIVGGTEVGVIFVDQSPPFIPPLPPEPPEPGAEWTAILKNWRGDDAAASQPVKVDIERAMPDLQRNDGSRLAEEAALLAEPSITRLEASFQRSLIIAGVAAGAAGLIIVSLFTRQALAPIRSLTGAARRLGSGDFSFRVSSTRSDEVGELAQTFDEMAAALEEAESRRRTMTADIAHELRTPLTNVRGYLEAIRDGVLKPDADTIGVLHEQTIHLARLVDDLRLLSLADAGALELHLAEEDLAKITEESVTPFRPRADEAGITLKLELEKNLKPVNVDGTRIRQVISNLVENALTHTPEGGTVTVSVKHAGPDAIEASIHDTGRGIPEELLPRVFDQFYRVDKSRSRSTGGAGLGLTIVRKLVEAHGGSVRAESSPGEGATLTVSLPTHSP